MFLISVQLFLQLGYSQTNNLILNDETYFETKFNINNWNSKKKNL